MTYSELSNVAARRYRNMKRRFAARYSKDGRLVRPELVVPFSLAEFTFWLRHLLGLTGTTRCIYCNWPITVVTMHIDHRIPISQGGRLELDNLAPACTECNAQKGELTEGAFRKLREVINQPPFTPHDCIDIKARLQSQLKLAIREQKRLGRGSRQLMTRIVPHRREATGL